MKKSIFSLMIGAIVALTSCSKSDEAPNLPQSGDQLATFKVEAPALTRATVTGLTRYIVEAYEGKDLTATPVRVEAATGSLTLELKKNTEYTFVFWADKGTANTAIATSGDYYDATSLQDVKVNPTAYAATVATPAYCLAVSFNSKDFATNNTIVLKNATAQLNFTEAAGLLTADNSLTVKYSSAGKLNVATGKITEIGAEISRTYANIGKIVKDGILATDYILAPLGEKRLLDLKVTFNSEPEKSITAVPFQQSYKTSVKGEFSNFYSSTFTVSDQVEDYTNNDVEFPGKTIFSDDFEEYQGNLWLQVDSDGDGEYWSGCKAPGWGYNSYGIMYSESYVNGNASIPDNMLVSPQVTLPATGVFEASWWVSADDAADFAEKYSVYIIEGTKNHEELLSDYLAYAAFRLEVEASIKNSTAAHTETLTAGKVWVNRSIMIPSAFAGKKIYLAFRHYDCTNMFRLKLDNVLIVKK